MSWKTSKTIPNQEFLIQLAIFHTAFACWRKFVSTESPLSCGDAQVALTTSGKFQVPELLGSSLSWEENLIYCIVCLLVVAWAPSFALWKVNQAAPKKGLVKSFQAVPLFLSYSKANNLETPGQRSIACVTELSSLCAWAYVPERGNDAFYSETTFYSTLSWALLS